MKTVVSVIGKDTVGIIAKVSAVCAECNANIVDITQSVLQDMFVMVMLTEISGLNCSFSEFSDKMKKIDGSEALDIRVMHEDIFNSMHRI
ncbi:MAG TPA: ACT domain-containing protein [Ruminococcaceae bacterium]|nr:ACT domain-containing protein [Oscillospiraceae bacterium]